MGVGVGGGMVITSTRNVYLLPLLYVRCGNFRSSKINQITVEPSSVGSSLGASNLPKVSSKRTSGSK